METIIILLVLGYVGYHIHLYLCRPEEYAAIQQRKHELELARQAARKDKSSQIVGGIAGAATKVLLGAVFNHKRH